MQPIAAIAGSFVELVWAQAIQLFGQFANWLYVVNPALTAFLAGIAIISVIALILLIIFTFNYILPAIPAPLLALMAAVFG